MYSTVYSRQIIITYAATMCEVYTTTGIILYQGVPDDVSIIDLYCPRLIQRDTYSQSPGSNDRYNIHMYM